MSLTLRDETHHQCRKLQPVSLCEEQAGRSFVLFSSLVLDMGFRIPFHQAVQGFDVQALKLMGLSSLRKLLRSDSSSQNENPPLLYFLHCCDLWSLPTGQGLIIFVLVQFLIPHMLGFDVAVQGINVAPQSAGT